ncbi:MAG TPA: hypothetical protein VI522_02185 [Gammaproteobacteria bacterium]|nr:hypothetical protein [Gammaproteobacteria bacterium]
MTSLNIQLMKTMKQFAVLTGISARALASVGMYAVLGAITLWLIHVLTAPMGGIVMFSAIFTTALGGFACAVVLFHIGFRLMRWLKI